jgi:CheY-like chemotaxis protein
MLNAPTALPHRQPLLHDADRLIATAQTLLAHSRVLIARGKARAEARACAAVRYEVSLAREGGIMAPHTPVTILLIDDEPSFVCALARLLRRDGYTVDTVDNGQRALALLYTQRYDLILCDLHMPVLDGPALYSLLAQQAPPLCQRVIFLTGDTLGAASTAFLAQCGQPCLYKPCTAAEVRGLIQQVLGAAAAPSDGS